MKRFENTKIKSSEESDIKDIDLEKNRLESLELIGRTVGDDCGMKVEVGKKSQDGGIYSSQLIKIEVDPNDIKKKGQDYCLGVICHEGSHRKISRVDFIPKEIWQERGFSFLMNAIEDPRVNNWVSEKYDGAREWVEVFNNEDLSQGKTSEEIAKSK